MFNILKAEYRKFLKGKLCIALVICIIAFPLFTGFLYWFLQKLAPTEEFFFSSEVLFMSSFSPLNNVGLIILIFIIVILMADFNQNTIRNKIIAGYSKNTIYLSSAIFSLSITALATTIYAFLSYLFVGLFTNFGAGSFSKILEIWLVSIMATMAIYAFVQMIVFVFKNLGAALGIVIGSFLVIFLAYTILMFNLTAEVNRIIVILVPLLQLSGSITFESSNIIWMVLSSVVWLSACVGFGLFLNKKLDYR